MAKWTSCLLLALVLSGSPVFTQSADPVTGRWGAKGATFFDLRFDGKQAVSGTVFWRGDGEAFRSPVRKGTFDPRTRALRLEGEARRPDGTTRTYVIEGTVAGDVISGRFTAGDDGGPIEFSRIAPPSVPSAEARQADFDVHKGDFDYLLGEWEFKAESKEYGSFRGYWTAVRLDEGQIIDEYRIVGDRDETYYVTTTLRNYNSALGRWELMGSDAGAGLQDFGTGRKVGNEIHIEQKFGVASGTPSVWRIRYFDIGPDGFSWTADRSDDDGRTWEREYQTIQARRIGPPRSLGALAPPKNAGR